MPAISCNISMATVERFALDMYVDTTAGHGQAAGSAATSAGEDEEGSALPRFSSGHRRRHGRFPHESPGVTRLAIVTDVVVNAIWPKRLSPI